MALQIILADILLGCSQLVKYPCVLSVKPPNKVSCKVHVFHQSNNYLPTK